MTTTTTKPTSKKTWGTAWGSGRTRQHTPATVLEHALIDADGERGRLYFGLDGFVWILNHTRETTCPSAACPACNTEHEAHA